MLNIYAFRYTHNQQNMSKNLQVKVKQVSWAWGLMAERFVVIQMSFWLKGQVKPNQMSPSDFLVSPWLLQSNLNDIRITSEMFSHGFHLTWLIKSHSGRPIVIQILTRWNKTVNVEPGRYLDDICPPPPKRNPVLFSIFKQYCGNIDQINDLTPAPGLLQYFFLVIQRVPFVHFTQNFCGNTHCSCNNWYKTNTVARALSESFPLQCLNKA